MQVEVGRTIFTDIDLGLTTNLDTVIGKRVGENRDRQSWEAFDAGTGKDSARDIRE